MAYLNGRKILNASVNVVVGGEGYDEGYEKGYEIGYEDGYVQGERVGYEGGDAMARYALWDCIQNGGNMHANMIGVFNGAYWTDETFWPKYDIAPAAGQYLFQNSKITDLKGILERCGCVLDVSNTGNFYQMFHNSTITRIPALDCSKASGLSSTFYGCKNLISIDEIKWTNANFTFSTAFAYCEELVEVRFNGVIENNPDFYYCPKLSRDSLLNIIECLAYTSTAKTCTLGTANLAKLTNAEKAIAADKGWTLA